MGLRLGDEFEGQAGSNVCASRLLGQSIAIHRQLPKFRTFSADNRQRHAEKGNTVCVVAVGREVSSPFQGNLVLLVDCLPHS